MSADFGRAAIVKALVALVEPYIDRLQVVPSSSMAYYTETRALSYKGAPLMFAAVRDGKAYTSYHFFPLYMWPEMIEELSPELRKRMQGKTCFNFRAVDSALFAELGELTERGFERYEKEGFL